MPPTACIEALYRTFSKYPRFEGYVECTHCVPEPAQDRLRAAPLRALDAQTLAPVVYNAGVGTFGEVADYKHCLPRIAEFVWTGALEGFDVSWAFSGLRLYNVEEWPAEERAALGAFLRAFLAKEVAGLDPRATSPIVSLLQDLARGFPTNDLIEAIDALETPSFAMVLGHLGWNLDGMGPELARVWNALATAQSARRVEPEFAALSERDDLHPILSDLLAALPATGP